MLDNDVKSVARLIFSAVDSPVAAKCLKVLSRGNLAGFGRISVDPSSYSSAHEYFLDAQCVGFIKKLDTGKKDKALEAKALTQFQECELQCAYTNRRLSDFVYNTAFYDGKDERLWTYVQRCKELLRAWLGPLPADLALAKFGKGATFSDRGRFATILDKMSSRPTLTRGATDVANAFWTQTSWFRALASEFPDKTEPETVEGNRFTTVPKDSTKRRCIAVEPSLNVFYQLAVGRVLKRRLKRIGIDLEEGQAVHRMIARSASIFGHYATLDLSNASDTMSRMLVKALLPPQWFELLDSLRSPKTRVKGKWYVLEKFSSMGNGFTFELETLIFLALLAALDPELVPGANLFVYGDDIIIPTKYADNAAHALQWAGFQLNDQKSFKVGPFRESCGGDYFNGQAVRPCFLKEVPSHPADWIALANSLWRTAVEHNLQGDYELAERLSRAVVLQELHSAWVFCFQQIPDNFRKCRGPHGLGDVVIHTPQWEWKPIWRNGIRYFRALIVSSRKRRLEEYPGSVALAALVYGVPADGVAPRGAPQRARRRLVPFS